MIKNRKLLELQARECGMCVHAPLTSYVPLQRNIYEHYGLRAPIMIIPFRLSNVLPVGLNKNDGG